MYRIVGMQVSIKYRYDNNDAYDNDSDDHVDENRA